MSFFSGKIVIVTGSSNGIGRGTAVMFAKEGAKVTITGRNQAALEETKKLCLQAGAKPGDLLELIGDVTNDSFNEKLISATVEKFGRLDVLVNNAGGASFEAMGQEILDTPLSDFTKMIDLNVKPVIHLSQLAVPHLEKTKGAIVNVSSIGAYHRFSMMPYYAASKSTLDQITIQMAGATQEVQAKMYESMSANPAIPLGRIGVPEDIGKIILFLADRSQSEILIGNIVRADGGVMLTRAQLIKVDEK